MLRKPIAMESQTFSITGQLVDVHQRKIYPAEVHVLNDKIQAINPTKNAGSKYILPGFIDAHIHIESSMLTPAAFGKEAVIHGTVATVSDPHEIANVCGIPGIEFMLENAEKTPLKINFGAPPCVPATSFETAGATITSADIETLIQWKDIRYLSEMMNFPGVLHRQEDVMAKIRAAQKAGKPIDGHAPGLRGKEAAQYAAAGISTDHECFTLAEALDKLAAGMLILIREGSAAKNFEALAELLITHPGKIMFCSDDKHPDELVKGHINQLVKRALAYGADLFDVLHAACVLPVLHYKLPVGLLRSGDPADFIVTDDLKNFTRLNTYINGELVAEDGKSLLPDVSVTTINQFRATLQQPLNFRTPIAEQGGTHNIRVIEALDGQLITNGTEKEIALINGCFLPDTEQDLLKIGVLNRYQENTLPSTAVVQNFGLKKGAIASSVAHDSHNIVFVGCDDNAICEAVNALIKAKGGISVFDGENTKVLPLPIAGLMSVKDAHSLAKAYQELDAAAKKLGSKLSAPFMTLSFMALPVIPDLKITDKGLFDVGKFSFTDLKIPKHL